MDPYCCTVIQSKIVTKKSELLGGLKIVDLSPDDDWQRTSKGYCEYFQWHASEKMKEFKSLQSKSGKSGKYGVENKYPCGWLMFLCWDVEGVLSTVKFSLRKKTVFEMSAETFSAGTSPVHQSGSKNLIMVQDPFGRLMVLRMGRYIYDPKELKIICVDEDNDEDLWCRGFEKSVPVFQAILPLIPRYIADLKGYNQADPVGIKESQSDVSIEDVLLMVASLKEFNLDDFGEAIEMDRVGFLEEMARIKFFVYKRCDVYCLKYNRIPSQDFKDSKDDLSTNRRICINFEGREETEEALGF